MRQKSRQLESLLVKPAGPDCFLNCDYCFYKKKSSLFSCSGSTSPLRMSAATLETLIIQALNANHTRISFAWQGGEPTLMGLPFFETLVALQKRHARPGQQIDNSLQTNGLLLNRSWMDFLAREPWLVGLSLDGPPEIHDRYRRRQSGSTPTALDVETKARLLMQRGIAVNALSVITNHSAKHAASIYAYLKSLGFTFMQFIPCVERNWAEGYLAPNLYADFLIELFELWKKDFVDGAPSTFVRWFDALFFLYVNREAPDCTLQERCGNYLVIEHDGSVYSCDFCVGPETRLGSISDQDSLQSLFNSQKHRDFGERKATLVNDCRTCLWLPMCHGGCPLDRIGTSHGCSHFCSAYKTFFAHSDSYFRELATRWHQQHTR